MLGEHRARSADATTVALFDADPFWEEDGPRGGGIYMHTAGLRLSSWDALPASMKAEIARHCPSYNEPPPLDDDRRNVTSWIYYKRVAEGEEPAPVRSAHE